MTTRNSQILLPLTRRRTVPDRRSEKEIQAAIVTGLGLCGYCVLVTSRNLPRTRCPNCSQWHWPNFSDKASRGIPDLLARAKTWPVGLWAGLEVKGATTKLSSEQKALLAQGAIVIVRGADEALDALERIYEVIKRMV